MSSFDVFGMCNPLFDVQAEVSDALLADIGLQKGTMSLLEEAEGHTLLARVAEHIVNAEPGGSGANTMIGVAMLGGSACYTGKLADDERGRLYMQGMEDRGVTFAAPVGAGATGTCVVLLTPDAERTMGTFLGSCRSLAPPDVDVERLKSSRYLYATAYLWDTASQREAVTKAMLEARAGGTRVAFSLSDTFCVTRNKPEILALMKEHVNIVIGNEQEACTLTGEHDARRAAARLAEHADIAVVTQGANGSVIIEDGHAVTVPAYPATPVDTTGAGDVYAAGILHAVTHDLGLQCGAHIGGLLASRVVSKLGARLDEIPWSDVDRIVERYAA
ncbi:MAG: adenosine kinase [Armatimonadetes bacterium]|nr:adenosine kinase [Armatimonadota bacterium]MDE2205043.1 adenosine kinase [Armatimonadota bacterium]